MIDVGSTSSKYLVFIMVHKRYKIYNHEYGNISYTHVLYLQSKSTPSTASNTLFFFSIVRRLCYYCCCRRCTERRVYPHWNAAAAATAGVKTDRTCCTTVCEEPERVWERPRAGERQRQRQLEREGVMEWGTYRERERRRWRGREGDGHVLGGEDHRAIVHVKTRSPLFTIVRDGRFVCRVCAACSIPVRECFFSCDLRVCVW